MINDLKSLVHRIGLIGVTNFFVSISSIILLPILTKNLNIVEYGIWTQVIVSISLIQAIASLGLPYSMLRFLSPLKNKNQIQEGFYSIFSILILSALLFFFLTILFSKEISSILFDNNEYITLIFAFLVFFECLNVLLLNYFRSFQKMKLYSLFLIVQNYSIVLFVSFLIFNGYGIEGALFGLLITKIVIFIMMILFTIKNIGISKPQFDNIKEYLEFGIPTVPEYLSSWIINSSDRYLIGILLGTAYVGYYNPGYTLGNMITMLLTPISFVLPPLLYRYHDHNNIIGVKIVLKYSIKYFLAISIPAVFGISILSESLLNILSTAEIAQQGFLITPFVALSSLLFGLHAILVEIILLKKKTKITGSMWTIAAILNLCLNLILIPYWGMIGAAVATLISFLFTFIITIYFASKFLKLEIDYIFILKSLLATSIMSTIIILWKPLGILKILICILVSVIVYASLLILLKSFDAKEINFIKNLLK